MVTLRVLGKPATKGSTVSFVGTGGRVVTKTDSARLVPWTDAVRWAAREAGMTLTSTAAVPGAVAITFVCVKPKATKRAHPIVRPEIDKWTRAALDALTGMAYHDDAQVVRLTAEKRYGEAWVTAITVSELLS
jgi:Holliday junction resolvase RusA-like endonuclease